MANTIFMASELTRDDIITIYDRCVADEIEEARRRAIKAYEERERLIHDIEYILGMSLAQLRDCLAAGYSLVTPQAMESFDQLAGWAKEEDNV